MKKKKRNFNQKRIVIILLAFVVFLFVVVFAISVIRRDAKMGMPVLENIEDSNKNVILGNKDDLVAFSVAPNTKVSGVVSYRGVIKGGYFFEGNILINVLDLNRKTLLENNATAKTDWMTDKNVEFEGIIDFSVLEKGPAYLEIHNDNASGLPENDKNILIPIIIE